MAEPCFPQEPVSAEEREFLDVLALIGGRDKIHLVSDVGRSKEDDDAGILKDFLRDMFYQTSFPNGHPDSSQPGVHCDCESEPLSCGKTESAHNQIPLTVKPSALANSSELKTRGDCGQKAVTKSVYIPSSKRTIDSPLIVFIFRQTFMCSQANLVCLKAILKDVKARTKRAKNAQPALVGLIRTTLESDETEQCAQVLENMMRSVFHRHAADSLWVGRFIPKNEDRILEIKKNLCRVLYSSRTADNTGHRWNSVLWPFQCLLGPDQRAAPRYQQNGSSEEPRRTGCHGESEEGIPLKTSNQSAAAHLDGASAVKDS